MPIRTPINIPDLPRCQSLELRFSDFIQEATSLNLMAFVRFRASEFDENGDWKNLSDPQREELIVKCWPLILECHAQTVIRAKN